MKFSLLLAFVATLSAQDFRATLNGTVLDSSGASVPKAKIEVANIARFRNDLQPESCRPAVIPPWPTITGQNFNVVLCPNAEIAVAIGAVLSRSAVQDYLIGLPTWSEGDTPRPRSKHVNATLRNFASHIHELIAERREDLRAFGGDLADVLGVAGDRCNFARPRRPNGRNRSA